jgi:hypothetical protein
MRPCVQLVHLQLWTENGYTAAGWAGQDTWLSTSPASWPRPLPLISSLLQGPSLVLQVLQPHLVCLKGRCRLVKGTVTPILEQNANCLIYKKYKWGRQKAHSNLPLGHLVTRELHGWVRSLNRRRELSNSYSSGPVLLSQSACRYQTDWILEWACLCLTGLWHSPFSVLRVHVSCSKPSPVLSVSLCGPLCLGLL